MNARSPEHVNVQLFISQLRGLRVLSPRDEQFGVLRDLVIRLDSSPYPPVRGLIVRARKQDLFIPVSDVVAIEDGEVRLRREALPDEEFTRESGDVLIENDLLDRQMIDVAGTRVIRANDAEVREIDGRLCLAGIDVSTKGILRRLGPRPLVGNLEGEVIDWSDVEPLATAMPEATVQLRHEKLSRMHPSDLARIVDSLAYPQAAEIMQALDDATAADTLEEIEEGRQVDILEAMPDERAADVLEEMAPDAAADVLDDMPREKADELMSKLDAADSTALHLLLSYPEDSAGGIMTTDFVTALETETTRQAIDYIRQQLEKPDLVYYVYIVDDPDNRRLRGVVSLRDLLLAEPDTPLRAYMRPDPRSVRSNESAAETARLMAEYNLLALPIVDDTGRMLGIVTADDALDILLPESLKRHVPRLFS